MWLNIGKSQNKQLKLKIRNKKYWHFWGNKETIKYTDSNRTRFGQKKQKYFLYLIFVPIPCSMHLHKGHSSPPQQYSLWNAETLEISNWQKKHLDIPHCKLWLSHVQVPTNSTQPMERERRKFPLAPMGVLAPRSAHAWPCAQPPINTSGNCWAAVSGRGGKQNVRQF